jgi:hypothetical protein
MGRLWPFVEASRVLDGRPLMRETSSKSQCLSRPEDDLEPPSVVAGDGREEGAQALRAMAERATRRRRTRGVA